MHKLRRAIRAGQRVRAHLYNHKHDGRGFWNLVSLHPGRDSQGGLRYFLGVQVEDSLRAADCELLTANY